MKVEDVSALCARLRQLSNVGLESSLRQLLLRGARIEVATALHLAEVEERRLHLTAGYPSMYDYCLKELHFSENETFHRLGLARVAASFPIVYELLQQRAIHLSAVCLLRRYLTRENHRELLLAACHKTKRQVEELLAERFPGREVRSELRRLPRFDPVTGTQYRLTLAVSHALKQKLELLQDLLRHANPSGDLAVVVERAVDIALVEVKKRRFALGVAPTASSGENAGSPESSRSSAPSAFGLRHAEPAEADCSTVSSNGGSGGHTGESGQAMKPSDTKPSVTDSRDSPVPLGANQARTRARKRAHIPNKVRRAVAERDGLRCTYVSPSGKQCKARAFLELDHDEPYARKGEDTVDNLRLRCAAHNALKAEQDFGKAKIRKARSNRREQASRPPPSAQPRRVS